MSQSDLVKLHSIRLFLVLFRDLKSAILSLKSCFPHFLKRSIFLICSILIYFRSIHFSFSYIFLSIAQYMLVTISGTSAWPSIVFLFCFLNFVKLFLNKIIDTKVVGNIPGYLFIVFLLFFLLFPETHLFSRF